MLKRKEKKHLWAFIGVTIAVFLAFGFILFSIIQVSYSTTVDESQYTKYAEDTTEMYMAKYNGDELISRNYVILAPKQDEKIYFELRLISEDVSSGQNRPLGMLEYGVVSYGTPYEVDCWWGDNTDWSTDCSLYVEYYHKNVVSGAGGSCDEVWESCQSGYVCESGICVSDAECSVNSDCPDGGYSGTAYCYGGNVVRDFNEGFCSSAGDCGYDTDRRVQEECDFGCSNGACLSETQETITPPVTEETCTEGETRATSNTRFVCGELVTVREICVGNEWQEVSMSETICDSGVNVNDVYNQSSPSTTSGETDADWTLIIITILSSGVIIGAILIINNFITKSRTKKKK